MGTGCGSCGAISLFPKTRGRGEKRGSDGPVTTGEGTVEFLARLVAFARKGWQKPAGGERKKRKPRALDRASSVYEPRGSSVSQNEKPGPRVLELLAARDRRVTIPAPFKDGRDAQAEACARK